MAHLHNTSGFADEARAAADYYRHFASLRDVRPATEGAEMDTARTVRYLKEGFSLFLP